MKKLLATAVFAACSFGLAQSGHAGTTTFSGTLTGSPDYHRPSYTNPNTPAFNCTDCGFQEEFITVSTTGSYTFSIISSDFADQVGILYHGDFDPIHPMANFVGPLSFATYNTGSATVSLTSNVKYSWVTSTDLGYAHDNCDAGCAFTTKVSGPGNVIASVPEPSTWAMMLIGFGGLGATLRSRRRWAVSQA